MKLVKIFLFSIALFFSYQASAEIYKDFKVNDTLAEIKSRYPNAQLVEIKAAWVKAHQAFIGLSGVGIVGKINLKFSTGDDFYRELIKQSLREIEKNPSADNSEAEQLIKDSNEKLNRPLDERLSLDWLRWISPSPIPFDRVVNKYGKPEKCDLDPDTFAHYCAWESKGLSVNLSDDKTNVYSIEYYSPQR